MPLQTLRHDIVSAFRLLRKSPGFTVVAVLSLALGIGAATAIFTVVNGVLLRPLPYADPDRLVVIGRPETVAPGTVVDWQERARSFSSLGAAEYWTPNLSDGGHAEQIYALHVTPGIFTTLGVPAALGRTLEEADAHDGHDDVAVVADSFWRTRLQGAPDAIGRQVRLDGRLYTVVGIMPASFRFAPFWATKAEVWAPAVLDARRNDREGSSMRVFARLAPGVTIGHARDELGSLQAVLDKSFTNTNHHLRVVPLQERVVGDVRRALVLLLAAVGLVLLIACSNVAHLQLVRGAARARELALRSALGASRPQLVRHLAIESVLVAAAGCSAGSLLAAAGVRWMVRLAPPSLPRIDAVSIDWRVLAFAVAISAAAALFFGLLPAWRSTAVGAATVLNAGPRGTTTGSLHGGRRLLVISEIAMAIVLLAGGGLLFESFRMLSQVNSGISPHHLLTAEISVKGTADGLPGRRQPFFEALVDRLRRTPGIERASAINHLPLAGDMWRLGVAIQGRPNRPDEDPPSAIYRVVMPGYFATMGIPILQGRDFDGRDTSDGQHVVIINEAMARRLWPNADPVGQHITNDDRDPANTEWDTIVGVAANAVQHEWGAPVQNETFYPFAQTKLYTTATAAVGSSMTVVVRAGNDPSSAAPLLRQAVSSMNPGVAVSHVSTMDAVIDDAFTGARFYLTLLSIFAGAAMTLALVGLYGVLADVASARRHEIGIRLALGATRAAVLRGFLAQSLGMTLAGVAAGVLAGIASTRGIQPLLYGVEPFDPRVFAGVSALVVIVSTAAALIPARRAAATDPMTTLRGS